MIFTQFFKKEVYSDESEVWRYIDFSKFVDLLDSSCLFFPRLTILRDIDPYEGSFIPFSTHEKKDDSSKKLLKQLDKALPNDTFVSCWYLSDVESAALWKLFPKSDEGIAIKSNIYNLSQSVKSGEYTIYMGSVIYGHEKVAARKTNKPKSFSGDDAVFTKRRCFEHEKELRMVMYVNDIKRPVLSNGNGIKIEVDLESMISEIVISPEAPLWMEDLVKRITKKYGYSFEIRTSTLNQLVF
jgi:hypothetical protein